MDKWEYQNKPCYLENRVAREPCKQRTACIKEIPENGNPLKFIFSEKATKIDEIFTVDLTDTTYCQIDSEDFVNFCGLLRKNEL